VLQTGPCCVLAGLLAGSALPVTSSPMLDGYPQNLILQMPPLEASRSQGAHSVWEVPLLRSEPPWMAPDGRELQAGGNSSHPGPSVALPTSSASQLGRRRPRLLARASPVAGQRRSQGQLRAASRRQLVWAPPRLLPWLTRLAAFKVRPTTQQHYLKALRGLAAFMLVSVLPCLPAEEWDPILSDYLEWMYDAGRHLATAARVPPALLWGCPSLAVTLRTAFPLAMRSLAGWRRAEPLMSRAPLPWEAAAAIAVDLVTHGFWDAGLAVVVAFETYLRPSSLLALTGQQVVLPIPGAAGSAAQLSLVAHAWELKKPSKTGDMDLTVVLDLPRQQWLTPLLAELAEDRGPHRRLFNISYAELARAFRQSVLRLGLACLEPTLYCLRHGGASHDIRTGARDLRGVQARGHWRAWSSVRRYEKHGRIGMQLQKLTVPTRRRLSAAAAVIESVFTTSSLRPLQKLRGHKRKLSSSFLQAVAT